MVEFVVELCTHFLDASKKQKLTGKLTSNYLWGKSSPTYDARSSEKNLQIKKMLNLAKRTFSATPLARSFTFPAAFNEPMLKFSPGSAERAALRKELKATLSVAPANVPCIINGKSIMKSNLKKQVIPSRHGGNLCLYSEEGRVDGIPRFLTRIG
jgi:hypothetical protein